MSPEILGVIGIVCVVLLIVLKIPIIISMATIGFIGTCIITNTDVALGLLSIIPYEQIASYTVTVIPLFMLMGIVASSTNISGDLFKAANSWLGRLPGGLAVAAIAACAGFAAVCGSSMASSAAMGVVAIPEMDKFNYDRKLSSGSVCAAASLGIMIPPSMGFILYSLITEESIGLLFMAGILPGILLAILMMIVVVIKVIRNPKLAPLTEKTSMVEKMKSLIGVIPMLLLFLLVMGGIFMGIFTPTEAGGIGAVGAIAVSIIYGRFNLKILFKSLQDTLFNVVNLLFLMVGAYVFMRFLAMTNLPYGIANFVSSLTVPTYVLFACIIGVYILLGMFLDIIPAIVLTLPMLYPTILNLGYDPIWFGVITVVFLELGHITPPVAVNAYVLSSAANVKIEDIFIGVWPFVLAMVVGIVILIWFPQIALYLPNMMR